MSSTDQGWLPATVVDDEDGDLLVAVRRGVLYRRRRVGRLLPVAVAVLGLGAAVAGQFLVVLPGVENQVRDRTTAALRDAGLGGLTVRVDGRDVILEGTLPSTADVDRAVAVVQGVDGVRVVREVYVTGTAPATAASPSAAASPTPSATASGPSAGTGANALSVVSGASTPEALVTPSAAPTLPADPAQLVSLAAVVDGGRAVLAGVVPKVADRTAVIQTVVGTFGAQNVENRIVVQPTAGNVGALAFAKAVAALGPRTVAGALSLQAGLLRVSGTVADAGTLTAISTAIRDAVAPLPAGIAPSLVVDPAADPETSVASAAAVAVQLAALPTVPFANGSATLGPAGRSLLTLVVDVLKAHPDVAVTVQVHVAANDADAAKLSSSRADAVVSALQQAGIPGARLQARGLGSTQPKVLGDTPAADAWNRRVQFVAGA